MNTVNSKFYFRFVFCLLKREGNRRLFPLGWLLWLACVTAPTADSATVPPGSPVFDEGMQAYKSTPASGAIAALQQRLERGETRLPFESRHGYLLALLRELNVPSSSQLLVASKTSPNKDLISPQNPRALYYNDRVSVAYVPSAALIELAAADPKLGVVFYTLDQKEAAQPRLVRDDRCLECHASSKTLDVPGWLVRSFLTKDDGDVDVLSGILVTHRTPVSERWGGYYVTGKHGTQTHRGNLFGAQAIARHVKDPTCNANITDLKPLLDVGKYPESGSDLVALLVLEHQAHMQTLLTRMAYDANQALQTGNSPRSTYPAVEAALKYMLFLDEAKLSAPVCGSSDFTSWFEQQGPPAKQGRSLRQFDLQTRLFKFPCSFMIYSPAFDALPAGARKHFYQRLLKVLSGEDTSLEYKNLSAGDRRAVFEILTETKSDLPSSWQF